MNQSSVYIFSYKRYDIDYNKFNCILKSIISNFKYIYAEQWICEYLKEQFDFIAINNTDNIELIISIGGDGTLLEAAKIALNKDIPLFGINMGRLGFLSDVDFDGFNAALIKIANGDYIIESRMILEACIDKQVYLAVNDLVLTRAKYSKLISVCTYYGDDSIACYFSDGVIVASPTGSTAYSLSAGGTIVSPDLDCMLLTPICAHSLQHKPLIVSCNKDLKLKLNKNFEQTVAIEIDGKNIAHLNNDDCIIVRRSTKRLKLIRINELKFFNRVKYKLSEWSKELNDEE